MCYIIIATNIYLRGDNMKKFLTFIIVLILSLFLVQVKTYAIEGTDDTVSGWYEDFEMCYKFPNRSDEESIKYINRKMRSEKEIREYLKKKEISNDVINKTMYGEVYIIENRKIKKICNKHESIKL